MKPFGLVCVLGLFACASDNEIRIQRKELRTDKNTYDAGVIASGDRETFPVLVQSVAAGRVTITDIQSSDPQHFVVLDTWKRDDLDNDGIADGLVLYSGSEDNPSQEVVEINFRPDGDGLYRARLTILSDDSTSKERTEDDQGIWRAAIRGIGETPCANYFPKVLDFGKRPAGGYFEQELEIRNCGEARLTISSFQFAGSTSFYSSTTTPKFIFNEESLVVDLAWVPGSTNPESAVMSIVLNDPEFTDQVPLVGNDCTDSNSAVWDADEDGWTICGGDCDDNNAAINPSQPEMTTNGQGNFRDDNCNGIVDEETNAASDDDGDGVTEENGDCHDGDPSISPNAEEIVNRIDDDCNGLIDDGTVISDDDGDGFSDREGDCDDSDPEIGPNAEEITNSVDDNCDGNIDEGSISFDDDGDGFTEEDGDCNDADPWVWPNSQEDCDSVDNDCDGLIDEGDESEENGACSFIVEREQSTPTQNAPESSGGCSTVSQSDIGLRAAFLSFTLCLLIAARRR